MRTMASNVSRRTALGKEIVEGLYNEGLIKTWYRDKPEGWVMASGLWSPFYINFRLISSHPQLYQLAAEAMAILVEELGLKPRSKGGRDKVVGIAMAGIPFANAISLNREVDIPSLYTRKLPEEVKAPADVAAYLKAHGQKALVEGDIEEGDRLTLVDDLVTKFDSKLLAIGQVRAEVERLGLKDVEINRDIIVLLDREQGAVEKASSLGYRLHALIPFASKGIHWLKDSLKDEEYRTILDYLKDPQRYQSMAKRNELAGIAPIRH